MNETVHVVFFGTPEFAVPALQALAANPQISVLAAVTQPDAPSGRGHKLTPSPIKKAALALEIPVFQPDSIKGIALLQQEGKNVLRATKAGAQPLVAFLNALPKLDLFVCVAYGKLIPKSLLEYTPQGMVNIHPSLLPRWRGAAPIQHALFAGDDVTGVALMQIDEGLDSGPIYKMQQEPIFDTDTSGSLHERLSRIGSVMLADSLPDIASNRLKPTPQPEEGQTYAAKWEREDCLIRWSEPAAVSVRRIRTCDPWPGARTILQSEQVKVFSPRLERSAARQMAAPGTIVEVLQSGIVVSTGEEQYIVVEELQFPGKTRLHVAEILRGRTIRVGEIFE